jgi:hypothetical protein
MRRPHTPHILTALLITGLVALVAAPAAFAATDLNTVISNLSTWITGLLATLATLMLLIGGVRYILAAGDPGSHEKAKGAIRTALVGYALALLAPVLTTIVQQIVGG